jgi:hypothetical protein
MPGESEIEQEEKRSSMVRVTDGWTDNINKKEQKRNKGEKREQPFVQREEKRYVDKR